MFYIHCVITVDPPSLVESSVYQILLIRHLRLNLSYSSFDKYKLFLWFTKNICVQLLGNEIYIPEIFI